MVIARRKTESFSDEAFAIVLDAEAEAVRALYASGKLRAAWSRDDVLGACLLLECDDSADAQSVTQSLPLASKGMLETQIIPMRGYRGFCPPSS